MAVQTEGSLLTVESRAAAIEPSAGKDATSKHFVFVHGACHGAWSWYKIADLLRKSGHRATALDLPASGIDSTDPATVTTVALLSQPVYEFFKALPATEKVILVGHSMGGIVLPYIMERFPEKLSAAVFATAFMFPTGELGNEVMEKIVTLLGDGLSKLALSPTLIAIPVSEDERFYNLSPSEDVTLSDTLRRPFPLLPLSEMVPDYTPEKYGSVPRVYIQTLQDRVIPLAASDVFIQNNPPARVIQLNSDHSPFFSDAENLHRSLLDVAATYA